MEFELCRRAIRRTRVLGRYMSIHVDRRIPQHEQADVSTECYPLACSSNASILYDFANHNAYSWYIQPPLVPSFRLDYTLILQTTCEHDARHCPSPGHMGGL